MLKVRERTNTWPGFVDLFSNLVILLVFLLIVFVFLWAATNVFGTRGTVGDLSRENAAQTEIIEQMSADEEEARRLLYMARDELDLMTGEMEQLSVDNAALLTEIDAADATLVSNAKTTEQIIATYEEKINNLTAAIESVTAQLEVSEQTSIANQAQLAAELEQLNAALTAAELRARETETQYVALSERLNRAMADRIAELNQYQSQFYGAVKMALADTTSVDTSTDRFVIGSDILFARGKYNLSPEGKKQLQLIAGAIANLEEKIPTNINWIIRVDGHTDKTAVVPGTQAYKNNQELSLLRARAVVSELAANGVSPRRLIPAGMGDMYPVQLGTDAESLQANRRIELRLTNP